MLSKRWNRSDRSGSSWAEASVSFKDSLAYDLEVGPLSGKTLWAAFAFFALRLYRTKSRRAALHTYLFSLAYLALLFAAMVVDARL